MFFPESEPPEATFKGNEYLTYDLIQMGGEPIVSKQDEISLHFRTNRADGLLFYTGNCLMYTNICTDQTSTTKPKAINANQQIQSNHENIKDLVIFSLVVFSGVKSINFYTNKYNLQGA